MDDQTSVYDPAGFWIRLFALFLDGLIIGIPISILEYFIFGEIRQENWVSSIIYMIYQVLLPSIWNGFTFGKRIVGIRIVKLDGENVGFGRMILRVGVGNIIGFITWGASVIVSAFMVGIRKDKRAIHDFVAGTYVTSNRP